LNELEEQFPRIKNYHVTNREIGNKVIFLRKLARGGSTHSFGIHVAKMAGMPPELIRRANEILLQLESQHVTDDGDAVANAAMAKTPAAQVQLSIFDEHSEAFREIRELLAGTDIDRLTPVEALIRLQEIKNRLG
jgi:DNA mismatch repair protein MutS